ncbi:MAG TPA: hypothetical protein VL049_14375 [Candidatus Dormibacteraeota bacterium]|nr:hypothetical protein [Candidatus Dormibacteraeota bacterium]
MRNADVRRACLALIHDRLDAESPALDPPPVALGWHLEHGCAAVRAMAARCAGILAGGEATRWRPSPVLRALLGEYGAVRLEWTVSEVRRRQSGVVARRRAADALL